MKKGDVVIINKKLFRDDGEIPRLGILLGIDKNYNIIDAEVRINEKGDTFLLSSKDLISI